jgi:hypothetical protein
MDASANTGCDTSSFQNSICSFAQIVNLLNLSGNIFLCIVSLGIVYPSVRELSRGFQRSGIDIDGYNFLGSHRL